MRLLALLLLLAASAGAKDFRADQQRYPRVRRAYQNASTEMKAAFQAKQLAWPPAGILLRVFKQEGVLELWGRKPDGTHLLVRTFEVCRSSGKLGPKRKSGDRQVPEGFYEIDRFNPASHFHLSLGVNYPNASDRVRSDARKPGGDIFIHGSCVTIGCVPLGDEAIEALYVVAVEAKAAGQRKIPVHILPARMTPENFARLIDGRTDALVTFWKELEAVDAVFRETLRLPKFRVDGEGRYLLR